MTPPAYRALQLAVLANLEKSNVGDWSVQGLGMLRYYIRDLGRIHIWHKSIQVPGVTKIHNHSWDFKSTIVAGRLRNQIFHPPSVSEVLDDEYADYWHQNIVAGYNFKVASEPDVVALTAGVIQAYAPGGIYLQRWNEIHTTDANDGTVTLIERHKGPEDAVADVYWPLGYEYGNAKPRPATIKEFDLIVSAGIVSIMEELNK